MTIEVTGRERSFEEAAAEMNAARRLLDYEEMRGVIAERYGWTFDAIDALDFDRIASAWRHLAGKSQAATTVPCDPRAATWGDYLKELVHGR